MAFLDVRNVSLSYDGGGGTLALQDCSLSVERGDFVALVGPSGCGKSSLLKVVSGLHPISQGAASLNGELISGPQHGVGMAFQNATLLPWRSTLSNVLLPLEVSDAHRRTFRARKAEHIAAARELLSIVGLSEFESHAPYQLSGGMQQRASLCRSLIHDPDLLLLDEPFAALDAFTREELWGVLQELHAAKKFTVVLVTHDLRESVYLADTVHVVSQRPGRIVTTRTIDLPRPRTLESTFEPEFVDIVHELRNQISEVRAA